jgi:alpha-L-fucosidase 2
MGHAWRINLWARLGDGNRANEILKFLLSPERTYPNLFDAHPPFQIDGNFGGVSGIVAMLVGERRRGDSFAAGAAVRMAVRPGHGDSSSGGFEIDMSWRDRAVERATVRSRLGRPLRLRRGEVLRMIDHTSPNTVLVFDGEGLRPVFGSDR